MLVDTIRSCIPPHIRKRCILRETTANIVMGVRGINNHALILLVYNPDRLRQITTTHPLQHIVWHELFHYIFGHVYEPPATDAAYAKKRNVAMDCQINSYIDWTPGQITTIAHPTNWGLPIKLTWREYMDLLPELPEAPQDSACSMDNQGDGEMSRALEEAAVAEGHTLDVRPPAPTKNAPRGRTRNILSQVTRVLEEEAGYYSRYRSLTRPHKTKGVGYAGRKKAAQPKVMVALDASGSISTEQHSAFMATIRRLMSEIRPLIVEFDDSIRHIGRGLSGKYWGGGTNFELVQNLATTRGYDTIIWFTDCEGSFIKDDIYHVLCNISGTTGARPSRFKNISLMEGT